jgi:hypothetical protein
VWKGFWWSGWQDYSMILKVGNVAHQYPSSYALSYFLFSNLTSKLDGLKIKNPSHKWKGFWWSGWQDYFMNLNRGNVAHQNPSSFALSYFLFPILISKLNGLETKNPSHKWKGFWWSGWQDSNLRPPAPKAGAITGLRYTPKRKY